MAAEVRRILRPGGRLVICSSDWIPLPGNVPEVTERLLEKHNPAWDLGGGRGIHSRQLLDAQLAGFENLESFSFDFDAPYSHEAWRGRMRASAGVAASLPPAGVAAFDAELAKTLAERFPKEPLRVLHRVFAVIGRAPGAD